MFVQVLANTIGISASDEQLYTFMLCIVLGRLAFWSRCCLAVSDFISRRLEELISTMLSHLKYYLVVVYGNIISISMFCVPLEGVIGLI